MLTALLADLHSNLFALEACLRHARARGAERFVFLGDLVGYGPDPSEVIELVSSQRGALVIKGNHDEAIEVEPKLRDLNDVAYATIAWTRKELSTAQRGFLAALPLIVHDGGACFVHGSASRPEKWRYVQDAEAARESMAAARATHVFCGHVHDQLLYFGTPAGKTASFRPTPGSSVPVPGHRHWLAIVGSVGQPRDGNPAAAYALFDAAAEAMSFFRVPYDHEAAARRIVEKGMPLAELLAERIRRGG
jgi:diadenosine tetraphosphatase ApaH/serine/threonine PP2A family protein phosphatase